MSTLVKVLVGAIPVIAVLVAAAFFIPADFPHLPRQLILTAWAIVGIFAAEWLLFGPDVLRIVREMGFVVPSPRAVIVALVVSVPMWVFLPLFAAATGVPITVNQNWLALFVGVILVNGIAEEVIHRAYIFGHLKREHSFTVSVWVSAAVFAAQHLYLIVSMGPAAGGASVLLAMCLAFPFAFLYERGGNSIGAPAILHTSSNAPMVLFASPELIAAAILPHMAVVLGSMFLSFAFTRYLDRPSRAVSQAA